MHIVLFSSHEYTGSTTTSMEMLRRDAESPTATVFMTEHVHKVLTYEFGEHSTGTLSKVRTAVHPHVCRG
jgi:hypothetical protein